MREILFLCTHIYAFLPHALSRYENIGKNPTSSSFLLQNTKTEDTNQLLLIHIPWTVFFYSSVKYILSEIFLDFPTSF